MTTEPEPKAIKKKKRLRTPREEFVAYVVVIDGSDWSYTLRRRRRGMKKAIGVHPAGMRPDSISSTSMAGSPGPRMLL
jgi:hypothetical protein